MTFIELSKHAYRAVHRPVKTLLCCAVVFVLVSLYPSDHSIRPLEAASTDVQKIARWTDDYGRFAVTALQVAIPVLLADKVGLMQLAFVAVSTTVGTHGIKRLTNSWMINNTRLGQRPSYAQSKHNIPSGHSSMASCAAFFVCRRYGMKYALFVIPVMLLTMFARVALDDHTISAVLSGGLLGLICTLLFTSRYVNVPKQV